MMIKTSKIIQAVFAVIFAITMITCIVRGFLKNSVLGMIAVLILGACFTYICVRGFMLLRTHARHLSERQIDKIFLAVAGCVLVFQIIFFIFLQTEPISDLSYVNTAAKNFAETGDTSELYRGILSKHQGYLARYPNNQALFVILAVIYSATDTLFGCMPNTAPAVLNLIGVFLSYCLMYLIAKQVSRDNYTPLYCTVFGALFSVFYTYTPFYYTDTMSMPFVMLSVWLFLKALKKDSVLKTVILISLSMVCVCIGYKIKGSVIILVLAYIIYSVFLFEKKRLKLFFTRIISVCAAFVIALAGVGAFINSFGLSDVNESYWREFPVTHWIMMGLFDRGGYNEDDFWYTETQGDYDQKLEADEYMIKERLKKYGFAGLAKHLAKKVSYTWSDGTYSIARFLKNGDSNMLRSFVTESSIFTFICSVYQCALLAAILFSFVYGSASDSKGGEVLLRIILMGIYFFLILWETRARYLVNFTPLFLVLAGESFKTMSETLAYNDGSLPLIEKGVFGEEKSVFRENKPKN